jgi:hypothetical protein
MVFDPNIPEPKKQSNLKCFGKVFGRKLLMIGFSWSKHSFWRITKDNESYWLLFSLSVNVMNRAPRVKIYSFIFLKFKITASFAEIEQW